MHWKNFLHFSAIEKITILILLVLIVLFFGFNVVLSKRSSNPIAIPLNDSLNDSLIASFERLQERIEDKKTIPKSNEFKSGNRPERSYTDENTNRTTENNSTKPYSERSLYTKQEKFTTAAAISLNETDTAQWKMVPGIGSAFSARIVKYQEKLGGYISLYQLKEVYGVTDELFDDIAPFIREDDIGTGHCVKLNINQLEFKEILAHPYIDYEQTKAIVNLRRRTGNITSTNELAMLDEFTSEDIERIAPYIDF